MIKQQDDIRTMGYILKITKFKSKAEKNEITEFLKPIGIIAVET